RRTRPRNRLAMGLPGHGVAETGGAAVTRGQRVRSLSHSRVRRPDRNSWPGLAEVAEHWSTELRPTESRPTGTIDHRSPKHRLTARGHLPGQPGLTDLISPVLPGLHSRGEQGTTQHGECEGVQYR